MINQAAPQSNDRVKKKVLDILDSGQYVKGPEAEMLEQKFAAVSGSKYNISVNSGTSALNLIFIALNYPPGSEVIVPVNSFMASSNAVETAGYNTIFCEVDPKTMNIDPEKIEALITENTRAILVVHLYGSPADMDRIGQIASKHSLDVIEDACQAHGALYRGKKIGSIGKAAAFSLFPTKNLTVLGDGGMVATNDDALGRKIEALKNAGRIDKADDAEYFGFNYRLSELLAGVGNVLIDDFDSETARRIEIAHSYAEGLKDLPEVEIQETLPDVKAVYHQFTIKTERRDALRAYLKENGIGTGIKYSVPLHLVTAYRRKYGYTGGEYPVAERLADQLLCLPMHPHLTNDEVGVVIEKIHQFFEN